MSQKSKIEWTDATWNPVRGCSRVSEGCRNCYAERIAARFNGFQFDGMAADSVRFQPFSGFAEMTKAGPRWTGKVELIESKLDEPLHWKKPRRIFVNSMSDLFHESLPDEAIDRVFAVMALCPQHTFQVLTKRPERMLRWASEGINVRQRVQTLGENIRWAGPKRNQQDASFTPFNDRTHWPLPNLHLGVSCENQATKPRIEFLRQTPAAVRFLSLEPLLENIGVIDLTGIHQVIVGGESGPGARPMNPDWVRSIRDQCVAAGVPFFFKQWGEYTPTHIFDPAMVKVPSGKGYNSAMVRVGKKAAGCLLDGRTWDEGPALPAPPRSSGRWPRPLDLLE
jgi:protein gp37